MIKLDTYLNFNGNTEEVFRYYKKVFGGEFSMFVKFDSLPGSEKMPAGDREKILNVSLPIGEHSVLMGTDLLDSMNQKATIGDNYHISISLDNETEARRIFDLLSDGGEIIMPLGSESWSALFGICKDRFGVSWMINYNPPLHP